ncbi:MAG: hypothetical protein ABIC18_00105, partial [Candidatus Omnitrophota bacterium]
MVKQGTDLGGFSEYTLFPLNPFKKIFAQLKGEEADSKELIGHLAIKGLKPEDEDKLHILLNQFSLIFKRASLYARIEKLSITDSL